LFVSRVFPDCQTDSCYKIRINELDENKIKAKLFDKLLFRHYSGWDDGMVNRLFVLDVESGKYEAFLSNPYNIPTALLGGYQDYALSPDGVEVCFAMSTDTLPAVLVNNDLYVINNLQLSP